VLHGGGGIGTNMNTNEVIANLANEKLGGGKGKYDLVHYSDDVNASQSTSDVCHTAIRMAIIHSFSHFSNELRKSVDAMARLADKFQNIETISRTCLQDGMKVQLGETFRSYETMIKRRLQGLDHAISQLYQINLGGTVIGSGIGAPQSYQEIIVEKLREVSNLPLFHRENLYDAAQNIDDLGVVSRELSLLASCLIKIAKDLRLRSSGPEAGFSELVLPAVQAGSSFFPGKVNPTIPETLIQCCFQVLGCDRTVQAALEHAELDLNVFEGIAGINILDALGMLHEAVSHFTDKCLSGIKANLPRCQELAGSFIPAVVELKEQIGYKAVSQLMKEKSKDEIKKMVVTESWVPKTIED
jgi:aspartate ammonia-lyase